MGPKIYAYSKNATTYTIRILPVGGYVRMAGLEDADEELKPGMPVSLITGDNGKLKQSTQVMTQRFSMVFQLK